MADTLPLPDAESAVPMLLDIDDHHARGSCSDHKGCGWLDSTALLTLEITRPSPSMTSALAAVVEMSRPRYRLISQLASK
jgi:hypothetical protein